MIGFKAECRCSIWSRAISWDCSNSTFCRLGSLSSGVILHIKPEGIIYFIDLKGRIYKSTSRSIELTWPGLVDQRAATAVWSEHLIHSAINFEDDADVTYGSAVLWSNSTPEQAQAARELVAVQRDLAQAFEEMGRAAYRLGVDEIYHVFRNNDTEQPQDVSYESVADFLIDRAPQSDPAKSFNQLERTLFSYAVYDYMMGYPSLYVAGTEARSAAIFSFNPFSSVKDLEVVTKWLRSDHHGSPIGKFIEKARTILRFSEKYPPNADAPPCIEHNIKGRLPGFDEHDRLILRVLQRALVTERQVQIPVYADVLANITQHLAIPSPGVVLSRLNLAVLKRLGVLSPWENLVKTDPVLAPWHDRMPKAPRNHIHRSLPRPDAQAVDKIRHDFGNLPVYVIDGEDASELDDGISIEPANDVDGQKTWWTHVHIADPTHVLDPTDSRAFAAYRRKESAYFPDTHYPLLNHSLLKSNHLSLGDAPEQRVLTFSTRLSEDGTVIESRVQAGVVRNTIVTTYDIVNDFLPNQRDISERSGLTLSTFPDKASLEAALRLPINQKPLSHLTDAHKADLQTLLAISTRHMRNRAQEGGIFWEYSSPSLRVHKILDTPLPLEKDLDQPRLFHGLPRASMCVPGVGAPIEPPDAESAILKPSSTLVSEMMIIANSTAATHGIKKGLPLPFLGQRRPTQSQDIIERLYERKDPNTGRVSVEALLEASNKVQFPSAYTSPTSVMHWSLGLSADRGYTRATSPLRRHQDLIVHWMIKDSLINPEGSSLRLTPELEAFYAQPTGRIRRIGARAKQHWVLYTLHHEYKRWQVEGGDKHPELQELFANLEGVVQRAPTFSSFAFTWTSQVFLPSLGIQAAINLPSSIDSKRSVAVGDRLQVRISECKQTVFIFFLGALTSHL